MPHDDPDPTDPMTLTGVELRVDDPGAAREMAACFVEEYLRLGFPGQAIVELFEGDDFAGPAMAMKEIGREAIHRIIAEQLLLRGARGVRARVDPTPGGTWSLPVLES